MTTLSIAEFQKYDAALDGIGLILESSAESPFSFKAPDLVVERQDLSSQLEQNRLDTLFWDGNRSWHKGAGQARLGMPDASDPYKFLSSKGIDITVKGKATLLRDTALAVALANQDPVVMKMVTTDQYVYVASGQPNLTRFSTLDGSDADDADTDTETSQEARDLATDGTVVYVALGADGIHSNPGSGDTEREAFDSGVWADDTDVSSAFDSDDYKVGVKSLVVTSAKGDPAVASGSTKTVVLNLSTSEQLKIWVKPNRAMAAGEVVIWAITSTNNYFQHELPALPADAWYEDISSQSDWDSFGSADWATITKIKVIVPGVAEPEYKTSSSKTGTASSVKMTRPTGLAEGDLMIWSVATKGTSPPSPDFPAGWSGLEETATTNLRVQTVYKIAKASEADSYVADWAGTFGYVSEIAVYSGAAAVEAHADASSAASSNITAPTVTTTHGGCRIVGIYAIYTTGGTPAITPAAGMTERKEDGGTTTHLEISDKAQNAAGATGAQVATANHSGQVIGHTVVLRASVAPVKVKFDSLRSVANGEFTHWSDWDARALGWVKGALYAAGVKSGSTWRIFAADSGAGSVEIDELPEGWVVTDIAELAGFLYYAAYRGHQGAIYAYDGINPPVIAVPPEALAAGDVPLSLGSFYGAGMLIGCRRPSATGSGGQGVLYRAFPTNDGHLSVEELQTYGADDGKDYGIRCARQIGKYAYFGQSFADDDSSGLGIYLPETGGFTRDLDAAVSGVIADVVTFKGRKIFAVEGSGVYVEQETYVDEGSIISSRIDVNVSADKTWLVQESAYDLKGSTAELAHEYSTDDGDTWDGLTEIDSGSREQSVINLKTPSIQYRVTLLASSDNLTAPDLTFEGIGGWPATKPRIEHTLLVRAYQSEELRNGQKLSDPKRGWAILDQLVTLWRAGEVYDFQPPWYEWTREAIPVRVVSVTPANGWGLSGDEQGGDIQLIVKEAVAT